MTFHEKIIKVIKQIPYSKVASYGQIAAIAGNPRDARQVVRTLHTSSKKENLPWHRVINRKGMISLKPGQGYELQKSMLKSEGIEFNEKDVVNLKKYLWDGKT